MGNCPNRGNATNPECQSPITFNDAFGGNDHFNWTQYSDVSFLPAWQVAEITADKHFVENYVFRINATDGNMGIFYAKEPFPTTTQMQWIVKQIRFHYPAEHSIFGTTYDLEMEITLDAKFGRALWCRSQQGVLSILFKVDDTAP